MAQKHLELLFKKQMNRKEFLAHIGAAVLMVLGISGLIKNLLHYTHNSDQTPSVGYSSGAYGGHVKRS